MNAHLRAPAAGFTAGYNEITRLADCDAGDGIALAVLRLGAGERHVERPAGERAWLVMYGRASCTIAGTTTELRRASLFDESASCVHVAAGTTVVWQAREDTELTVYGCANTRRFLPRVFLPADVPNEHRGKGQVRNRSLRFVRTIFDLRNSPPEVELVLGEVVTLPGGWSSYPPHHHAQPEIYHYRFSAPQGYGHAELGDDVRKVRHGDTIRIGAGLDHAQVAAPGYAMYYAWVIRHLPGNPYRAPEFTPEHAWTLQPDASFWWPRELDDER